MSKDQLGMQHVGREADALERVFVVPSRRTTSYLEPKSTLPLFIYNTTHVPHFVYFPEAFSKLSIVFFFPSFFHLLLKLPSFLLVFMLHYFISRTVSS